ncbi:hypothetical protein, partial [Paraburkholderia strydomiana]|uniref:hypothetical protein n=1 Tax=Paraburkholderia strydomiana TaxID=1245417 RepID=UPI001BEAB831
HAASEKLFRVAEKGALSECPASDSHAQADLIVPVVTPKTAMFIFSKEQNATASDASCRRLSALPTTG